MIHTAQHGLRVAKVYKDSEWDDHIVKFYVDGAHQVNANYHAYDDREDAIQTADVWVKEPKANS